MLIIFLKFFSGKENIWLFSVWREYKGCIIIQTEKFILKYSQQYQTA